MIARSHRPTALGGIDQVSNQDLVALICERVVEELKTHDTFYRGLAFGRAFVDAITVAVRIQTLRANV